MITLMVNTDRENRSSVQLFEGNKPVLLRSVTNMALRFNGYNYSASSIPGLFDWIRDGAEGIVHLFLGLLPAMEQGSYTASLLVFDDMNETGINWGCIKLFYNDCR